MRRNSVCSGHFGQLSARRKISRPTKMEEVLEGKPSEKFIPSKDPELQFYTNATDFETEISKRSHSKHLSESKLKNSLYMVYNHSQPNLPPQSGAVLRQQSSNAMNVDRRRASEPALVHLSQLSSQPNIQRSSKVVFDSNFQSGNLHKAYAYPTSKSNTFYLFLRSDVGVFNTMWFYFSLQNVDPEQEYTFHIVNIVNKAKNFRHGQLPLCHVQQLGKKKQSPPSYLKASEWKRFGHYVRYYKTKNQYLSEMNKSHLSMRKKQKSRQLHTLTFKARFGDVLGENLDKKKSYKYYISYGYPFTYSDLQKHMKKMKTRVTKSIFSGSNISYKVSRLCTSVLGLSVPLLTITSQTKDKEFRLRSESDPFSFSLPKKKKGIVITARVHPGETCASWVMKGILDFLTSNAVSACELREKYVFKIVPMLNPDGVYMGSNRTSPEYADLNLDRGVNLNAYWNRVEQHKHPSLFYTKRMLKQFTDKRKVLLYLDLHGHSAAMLNFVFGYAQSRNIENKDSSSFKWPRKLLSVLDKFPNGNDIFQFDNDFIYDPDSYTCDGVGPVVVQRKYGVEASYTIETSLGGGSSRHMTQQDYENFGKAICMSCIDADVLSNDE